MPPGDTHTLGDQVGLLAGGVHQIYFNVLQPGLMTITSVPDHLPQHTDDGLWGTLTLQRPGAATPVASLVGRVAGASPVIRHQATADEVAIPGEWTFELSNAANEPLTFTTRITGPVDNVPLQSASIDIEFLNELFASAVAIADVHLHVESGTPGPTSFVSWSPSVASRLNGLAAYRFHVDDYTVDGIRFHLKSLDSDPQYPRVVLLQNPLRLTAILQFTPDATIETDPGPDVDLQFLQISVGLAFDGTLHPDCQAKAYLTFNSIDLSQALESGAVEAMGSALSAVPYASHDQVRADLDAFFSRLLRLDQGAQIRNYRTDQGALVVDYYVPPAVHRPAPAEAVGVAD